LEYRVCISHSLCHQPFIIVVIETGSIRQDSQNSLLSLERSIQFPLLNLWKGKLAEGHGGVVVCHGPIATPSPLLK
jgi:hypothetical protein